MTVEMKKCVCQDAQRHFLSRAFDSLDLQGSQRDLLLASFREKQVDLRTAAYEIAISRVNRAISLRGF